MSRPLAKSFIRRPMLSWEKQFSLQNLFGILQYIIMFDFNVNLIFKYSYMHVDCRVSHVNWSIEKGNSPVKKKRDIRLALNGRVTSLQGFSDVWKNYLSGVGLPLSFWIFFQFSNCGT